MTEPNDTAKIHAPVFLQNRRGFSPDRLYGDVYKRQVCQTIEHDEPVSEVSMPGQLSNFPVQIKLVAPNAPYFDGADLLIAADCTAYAYGSFHKDFIRGKVTLIGCPKLDDVDYSKKLLEIFRYNDIRSITVTRMTVPCCGGLTNAVKKALEKSRKDIPLKIITISPRGEIV